MIIEQEVPAENDVVRPLMDLKEIVEGSEFQMVSSALEMIKTHKNDKEAIHHACQEIAKSLRASFGMETTIAVLDPVDSIGFYGFNIYPSFKVMNTIIDEMNNNEIGKIQSAWRTNRKWHIDIDGHMLYDLSNRLNAMEMATLMLYSVEQIVFDYNTPIHIAYTIMKYKSKMNFVSTYIVSTQKLKKIYMIPFMIGCSYTSFALADQNKLTDLEVNSIVGTTYKSFARYRSAVEKIFNYYGRGEIIDQSDREMDHRILFILNWIYEGLNDLKYSSVRLKENLLRAMRTCRSPFVRLAFKDIILTLSSPSETFDRNHPAPAKPNIRAGEESYINPAMKSMQEKMEIGYWKDYVSTMESKVIDDILGRDGKVKKITREDLDMIRVEAENISSVDDKIYLLERLYKKIGALETSLDMIQSGEGKKVRQTKNELENLMRYAQDIRIYIIRYQIQPEHYGLYVKYPSGYEG